MTAAKKLRVVRDDGDRPSGTRRRVDLASMGVVGQVRVAFSAEHRLAATVGAVFGGFVPVAAYVMSHREVPTLAGWRLAVAVAIVAGGLVVSARTVYAWAAAAFADRVKAVGFTVLVEGVLTFAQHDALSLSALALVVVVNGVAAGCRLSSGR